MSTGSERRLLDQSGLERFHALRSDAVNAVAERFYATFPKALERFGARGREATREDLAFHLEFLRPVLEFGLLQPMVDYLRWLASVLAARGVPAEHLPLSLEWLAEFFAERLNAADAAVVVTALRAARGEFMDAGAAPPAPRMTREAWPEAREFEAALLAGSQQDALAVVLRCMNDGRSLVDVELHVIQSALYRIGERWQANEVSVAQEHMASAIVQSVMTIALLQASPRAANGKKVLLACVAGNDHAIGLRIVADAFLLGGWDVRYLGPNVPTPALIGQVIEWQPHLLGLSVSFAQQLPVVRDVIAQLDARLGLRRPGVIVGGLAINNFAPIAERVHADAVGVDARAALERAEAMVGGVS
ncbi:MAG TPA: cobalamin-dependent protein [Gemmatimonadaceae bacterium]